MSILRALLVVWLLRQALRAGRILLTAGLLAVLWPVTASAVLAAGAAWLAGWPPARLYRAAAWSSPMAAVWLVAVALRDRTWRAVAFAPVSTWHQASLWLAHGRVAQGLALAAPLAIPAGLAAGAAWWGHRCAAMAAGAAGRHAFAPAAFDARQWTRQARSARGRLAAPGPFPLATGRDTVPAGAVIRTVGRPWTPVLEIPVTAFRRHMVIVGSSGSGKTNLMIRLWAGWMAATLAAARRGRPRPLLVAMDCKGGRDARAKADRTRRVLRGRRGRPHRRLARRRHPEPVGAAPGEPGRTAAPDDRARRRQRRLLCRHRAGHGHPRRHRAARPAPQRGAVPRPAGGGLAGGRLVR